MRIDRKGPTGWPPAASGAAWGSSTCCPSGRRRYPSHWTGLRPKEVGAMAADVTKTPIRLADGRELIYFDEKPGQDRSQPDRRDLAATRTVSEIRYDVL